MLSIQIGLASIGLICILNTTVVLQIAKKLRSPGVRYPLSIEQDDELTISTGSIVGDFSTETVDGKEIGRADLIDGSVVAFMMPGCSPCKAALPKFIQIASRISDKNKVIVVISGEFEASKEMISAFRPVASVLIEGVGGPLSRAFRTSAFPTFYRLRARNGELRVEAVLNASNIQLLEKF